MNPTVKRSGWHAPEDTGLWAIADRVAAEACTRDISVCFSCTLVAVHPCSHSRQYAEHRQCSQKVIQLKLVLLRQMYLQFLWVHLLLGRIQVWDCMHDDDHEVLQVWEHLPNDRELFLKAEQAFFDEVTQVSGKLFPFPKDERKAQAVKILKGIHVPRKVPATRLTCRTVSPMLCQYYVPCKH